MSPINPSGPVDDKQPEQEASHPLAEMVRRLPEEVRKDLLMGVAYLTPYGRAAIDAEKARQEAMLAAEMARRIEQEGDDDR